MASKKPPTAAGPGLRATEANLQTPLSWPIIVPYGAMGFGYIIPATYLPLMAKEILESPVIFGMGWPVFGTAAALSAIFIYRFEARCSNRQIWITCQLIMAAGLLAPAVSPSMAAIIAAALCVGGTFMIIIMAGIKQAHRIAGSRDPQRHIAAMTCAFAADQITGPYAASWAFEVTGTFSYPLIIASIFLIITLAPMMILKR